MKILLDQGIPRGAAATGLVLSVMDMCKNDTLHGALISATQKHVRIRLLPLVSIGRIAQATSANDTLDNHLSRTSLSGTPGAGTI